MKKFPINKVISNLLPVILIVAVLIFLHYSKWFKLSNSITNPTMNSELSASENTKEDITDGISKFYMDSDIVKAMDLKTGKENWRHKLEKIYVCEDSYEPFFYNDEMLYVPYGGKIFALNSKTGKLIWEYKTNGNPHSIVYGNYNLYFLSNDQVYALVPYSGEEMWVRYLNVNANRIVVNDNYIFVETANGYEDTSVLALFYADGHLSWMVPGGKLSDNGEKIVFDEIGLLHSSDLSNRITPIVYHLDKEYRPPLPLPIEWVDKQTCNMIANYDKLMPIGWSKDGHFAYVIEKYIDGAGFIYQSLYLHDLETDNIQMLTSNKPQEQISFYTAWNDNYATIKKELTKAGILQGYSMEYDQFPLEYYGDTYSIEIEKEKVEVQDSRAGSYPVKIDIYLVSKNKGKKKIYEYRADPKKEYFGYGSNPYDISVIGYLKSPYEPRIAIIIDTTTEGWEGPPDDNRFSIVGAHLKKGFSR